MNKPAHDLVPKSKAAASPPAARGGIWRHAVFIGALLGMATLAVYSPVVNYDFINFDDPDYVTNNPHVCTGMGWENLRWAFTASHSGNWHPLTWLSHMVDCQIFGAWAGGHHLVNVLWHLANAGLLFALLRRLTGLRRAEVSENVWASKVAGGQSRLPLPETATATQAGAVWRSLVVAALFAWHPLHVESVAWVAERKDVLSTFFGLLSLLFYVRYAQFRMRNAECGMRNYWLALVFFACGLLSKPMLVTWPFLMLLLDWWPLRRILDFRFQISDLRSLVTRHRSLVTEKVPFFVLSAASCTITFWAQKSGGAVRTLTQYSLGERVENALVSYLRYLGKTFWPVDLAVFYPHPGAWPLGLVLVSVGVVVGLSLVAVWFRRRRPYFLVGWLWFVGTLVPVIGFLQVGEQSLADRYTYVPLVGLLVAVVWGMEEVAGRRHLSRMVSGVITAILLAACGVRTRDQLQYWRNSERLYRHALAVTKNNAIAHNNLGYYLAGEGVVEEAMEHFQQAVKIDPHYAQAYNNIGTILIQKKEFDRAVEQLRLALACRPDYPHAHYNLGIALAEQGLTAEAVAQYREALRLEPDYWKAHNSLGYLLLIQGVPAQAAAHYQASLQINPAQFLAHFHLGNAFALQDKYEAAVEQFNEALRLAPDYVPAYNNLARALARLGRRAEAVQQLREALRRKPDFTEAKQQLRELGETAP